MEKKQSPILFYLIISKPLVLDYYLPLAVSLKTTLNCKIYIVLAFEAGENKFLDDISKKYNLEIIHKKNYLKFFCVYRHKNKKTYQVGLGYDIKKIAIHARLSSKIGIVCSRHDSRHVKIHRDFLHAKLISTLETQFPIDYLPEHVFSGPMPRVIAVNSNNHKEIIENRSGSICLPIGYPKANSQWLKSISEFSENCFLDLPDKFVLILARGPNKNDAHSFFYDDDLNRTISDIVRSIRNVSKNAKIVIKSHPNQDLERLSNFIEELDIIISSLPTYILASKAVASVSMLTSAVLDVILQNKPVVHYVNEPSDYFYSSYPSVKGNNLHFGIPLITNARFLLEWCKSNLEVKDRISNEPLKQYEFLNQSIAEYISQSDDSVIIRT